MSSTSTSRPATSLPSTQSSHSNDLRQATLRKNMSITQTYYLAHKARAKLSREAAQPDHDLRLLVGHANLLDVLMIELADAEREQERWFNQTIRTPAAKKSQHIQWADRIEESSEEEEFDDDSSDSDVSEDDYTMAEDNASEGIMEDDLEEDYAQLELVRTPSHSNSPPELIDNDSDSSEDESMPPSPPSQQLSFSTPNEKQVVKSTTSETTYEEDFYQPTGLVSTISVY
ncbi:hypothetical protein NLU13_2908 [Sarocladium strictum]|uniref:Uncharacterized protein n=1 Tax=Sarocladium strictum TaxID=5046 RepID=A0AA39GL07_SARSR|nr:hypothetical protein NLU13_2908 [Sarocladium strictum]